MENDRTHRHVREIVLKRGDRLEASEGMCLRFWTIVTGTAAICSLLEDGRRQIVGLETDGDTVCALMSFADNPSWLEALEETVVCELDFSHDAASLMENARFISAMFEVVHTRLESTTRQVASLGRLDSTERVVLSNRV